MEQDAVETTSWSSETSRPRCRRKMAAFRAEKRSHGGQRKQQANLGRRRLDEIELRLGRAEGQDLSTSIISRTLGQASKHSQGLSALTKTDSVAPSSPEAPAVTDALDDLTLVPLPKPPEARINLKLTAVPRGRHRSVLGPKQAQQAHHAPIQLLEAPFGSIHQESPPGAREALPRRTTSIRLLEHALLLHPDVSQAARVALEADHQAQW